MRYESITVTPEMAREWLLHNSHNREIRDAHVKYFERLLVAGKAATTHQGIAIDTQGRVHDGQHRLTAIANTGIPWTMWVASDCNGDDFNKIDVEAKPRSIADRLHIHGRKNAALLASVGKFAWNWLHGNAAFTGKPDDIQINELIERYPTLADVRRVSHVGSGVTPTLLSFLCYIGPVEFVEEFELAAEGIADDSRDSSALRLAAKYRKWHNDGRKMTPKEAIAWFIIAANDHLSGREPRTVSYRESNQFPQPQWQPPIPFEAVIDEDDD